MFNTMKEQKLFIRVGIASFILYLLISLCSCSTTSESIKTPYDYGVKDIKYSAYLYLGGDTLFEHMDSQLPEDYISCWQYKTKVDTIFEDVLWKWCTNIKLNKEDTIIIYDNVEYPVFIIYYDKVWCLHSYIYENDFYRQGDQKPIKILTKYNVRKELYYAIWDTRYEEMLWDY
jgi:hypothetical protein